MTVVYNQSYGAGSPVLLSGLTGWHVKSCTPNESMEIDTRVKNATGQPITGSRHLGGERTEYTEVWEPDGDTSTLSTLTIGDISPTKAIVSASLECTNAGRPTLTLIGHVHSSSEDAAAKHIGDTLSCTFQFPTSAFGAVNPFPAAAGVSGVLDYEVTRSVQTYSVDHTDEPGRTGEFLVGVSRGATLTVEMNATTANTVSLGVASGDWAVTNKSTPTTNESVVKLTVTGSKILATTPASSGTGT